MTNEKRFHPKIELPSSQLFRRTPACPIPPQLSFLIEWLAPRPFPFLTAPLFPYFSTFNSISKHTATTVRSIVQNTLSQEEDILCRTQNHPDGRGRRSVWPKMPLELNSHSYLWLADFSLFLLQYSISKLLFRIWSWGSLNSLELSLYCQIYAAYAFSVCVSQFVFGAV